MLIHLLLVGTGGFAGAICRYVISEKINTNSSTFPSGTLIVNLSGSFLLGLIAGVNANEMILLLFGAGFLGALTTFSTLKLELTNMYVKNRKKLFLFYIMITYGLGIPLAYLGFLLGGLFV